MFRKRSIVVITLGLLHFSQIMRFANCIFIADQQQQQQQQQQQLQQQQLQPLQQQQQKEQLQHQQQQQQREKRTSLLSILLSYDKYGTIQADSTFPSIIDIEEYNERDLLGLLGKRAEMRSKRQGNTLGLITQTTKLDSHLGTRQQPLELLQWDGPSDTAIQDIAKANIESAIHTASILLDDLTPTDLSYTAPQIQAKIDEVKNQLVNAKQTLQQGPYSYVKAYIILHAGLDLLVWLFNYSNCCQRGVSIVGALQTSLAFIILLIPNNSPTVPIKGPVGPSEITPSPVKPTTKAPTKAPIAPITPSSPTTPQQTTPSVPKPMVPAPVAPIPLSSTSAPKKNTPEPTKEKVKNKTPEPTKEKTKKTPEPTKEKQKKTPEPTRGKMNKTPEPTRGKINQPSSPASPLPPSPVATPTPPTKNDATENRSIENESNNFASLNFLRDRGNP